MQPVRPEAVPALEVHQLTKRYAAVQAVNDLSFTVNYGEIFGLLGPNGAGKTTTIRMILDIIKPSAGQISVLGGPMREETKAHIGYLPEERGLYEDMKLLDTLLFLGQLKGLSRQRARERAEFYLREVDLWAVHDRQIRALSRGMNQKAQFVAAILHEPDLIIIDEPFSGLDPVNTRIIKQLIYTMCDRGAAIVMSTHQMHQVEEMCQRILLIDRGHQVLYGPLHEIRRQFADNAVEIELQGQLEQMPGVAHLVSVNGSYHLLLEENVQPDEVLRTLVQMPNVKVDRFERVQMSLDEIFIRVVGRDVAAEELAPAERPAP
ncbi:MAG: ATP-binding cassette domain-containing protein [Caldilineaceae bacterium]